MLKRLTATALVALLSAVVPPALARGQGHGSDKAVAPAAAVQAQKPPKPGMVWVNPVSGVYHREGGRYYGKTATGTWMTEADAKAKGHRLAGSPGVKEVPEAPTPKPVASGKPAAKAATTDKPGAKADKPGKTAAKPAQANKPAPVNKPGKAAAKPGKPAKSH